MGEKNLQQSAEGCASCCCRTAAVVFWVLISSLFKIYVHHSANADIWASAWEVTQFFGCTRKFNSQQQCCVWIRNTKIRLKLHRELGSTKNFCRDEAGVSWCLFIPLFLRAGKRTSCLFRNISMRIRLLNYDKSTWLIIFWHIFWFRRVQIKCLRSSMYFCSKKSKCTKEYNKNGRWYL